LATLSIAVESDGRATSTMGTSRLARAIASISIIGLARISASARSSSSVSSARRSALECRLAVQMIVRYFRASASASMPSMTSVKNGLWRSDSTTPSMLVRRRTSDRATALGR
jgi:hypothetical protein